jgi:hypothetical protein
MIGLVNLVKDCVGFSKVILKLRGNGDSSISQGKKLFLSSMMRLVISVKGYVGSEKVIVILGNVDSSTKREKKLFLLDDMMMLGLSMMDYVRSEKMKSMDSSTEKEFLPTPHLTFS